MRKKGRMNGRGKEGRRGTGEGGEMGWEYGEKERYQLAMPTETTESDVA